MKIKILFCSMFLSLAATSAMAESSVGSKSDKDSCERLAGQYESGYCLVAKEDIEIPSDTKWVVDENGTRYSVISVDGKNVVVFDGFLTRRFNVYELLWELFQSDEIGCSGRYTC